MKYWTNEQTAILRELWPTHSATAIIRPLDYAFTRNAIIGRANRLKLEKATQFFNTPAGRLRSPLLHTRVAA